MLAKIMFDHTCFTLGSLGSCT